MISPEFTLPRRIQSFRLGPCFQPRKRYRFWLACMLSSICVLGSPLNRFPIEAKEASVNAIALYDGPTGPAYVQITGVLLNGKAELRVCDGASRIDKHTYATLPRIQLTGATSLDRTSGGVLMLTTSSSAQPVCVVPSNLKFDKSASFTPAEAAEQVVLQGTVVASSNQQEGGALPEFKPGVRLVFVAAPDTELAEFLKAQRIGTVPGWRDFLGRYGSSTHGADARNAMAALFTTGAEASFAAYRRPGPREFQHLKQAQHWAEQAVVTVPGYPAARALLDQIRAELDTMLEASRGELQAYRKAVTEHTAGYGHLAAAKKHIDQLVDINAKYAPALTVQNEIWQETRKLDIALQSADALLAAQRYHDAFQALGPYLTFSKEAPRIEAIVTAVYTHHFDRGRDFSNHQDWEHAAAEFRAALNTRSGAEASAALKNAETQLAVTRDRQVVTQAIQQSSTYAENKQIIEAYEVLANLPEAQRSQVAEQMNALSEDYAAAATKRAQRLQDVHVPIRGKADEDAVREAYTLLAHASAISGDPATKLRLDLLSEKISAYYVDVARRYLDKPLGSGVGLGWLYLLEAQRYRPDLDTVRDAMVKYAPAYQLRGRLSVGILLRDQTSRRESAGFADQLADAIASAVETSGLSIKAVRQTNENAAGLQPSFLLVGEIIQHRSVNNTNVETPASKYRVGIREVRNEAWVKINNEYEAAQQTLTTAQRTLADLQANNKKKEIPAATDAVDAAKKQADTLRHQLDSTEQTKPEGVIASYNYTRKTIDLNAVVELAFRITDPAGKLIESAAPVKQDSHKTFVILENVKPEDTEGVKAHNAAPDELQFLADLEILARDALVKAVKERLVYFPGKVLADARTRAQQNDAEGAASQYIVYLNATPDAPSAERDEAVRFLREHFSLTLTRDSK